MFAIVIMFSPVHVYLDHLKLNKQFPLLEIVFDSVYVDLQYDEISLTFISGFVSLCCVSL